MALRYDSADLGQVTRTPQGGIKVPARLTRTGVFKYIQPDGSTRREYRGPEEVFAPGHLAALVGAPVTNLHPDSNRVDSENWRTAAVGHAGETIRKEASFVEADLYIQDAETIRQIEEGKRGEVSLGYLQDYIPGPGVTPEGEAYDGRQTNLRPNHIALVPRGRAGREVGLRLDSEDNQVSDRATLIPVKIKIGGVEFEAGSPEAVKALEALEASARRADAVDAEVKALRARVLADLKTKAKGAGAEFRADADANEVMVATLKKLAPGVTVDGMSDEWIQGAFAVAIAMALDLNESEPVADSPDPGEKPPAPGAPGAGAGVRADAIDGRTKSTERADAAPQIPRSVAARNKMIEAGRKMRPSFHEGK